MKQATTRPRRGRAITWLAALATIVRIAASLTWVATGAPAFTKYEFIEEHTAPANADDDPFAAATWRTRWAAMP